MRDKNPICTLGDYSKPSHEGYRNIIELSVWNDMDPSPHGRILLLDYLLNSFHREDVLSTSDRRLIELEIQVQCLMEAHLASTQPTQVNKITTSCEICNGPHNTQYCMEDLKQAFVEYASSCTDEAGGKWYTFKPEQNNIGDNYNPSWRSHSNLRPAMLNSNPRLDQCHYNPYQTKSASYDDREKDNKEEEDDPKNIHVNPPTPPDPSLTFVTKKVLKFNSFFESLRLVPPSSNTELVCTKEEDGDVMFIEIFLMVDNSHKEEPKAGEQEVQYLDIFLTRSELASHKRKHDPRDNMNKGVSNFTGRIKGMHVFVGNFTNVVDFMIIEDISSIIDPRLSQVVLGKPFVEISNMTHDPPEGVVRFTNRNDKVAYKMPYKIEQYNSLSNLEKEHIKLVYLRNEEDNKRGVEYVMNKILGFYKESRKNE
uniref:Retrotransposon Orf1 n=1 Tax=Tanacetum cinerariifolium TaxID=118510 RepID=A0A699JDK3_TANCI|nr:retrotransposon Orf1 [Tanacetum cinerariifolium]